MTLSHAVLAGSATETVNNTLRDQQSITDSLLKHLMSVQIVSVANLTRADAREFLQIAPQAGIRPEVTRYPLAEANSALADLREGRLQGAAVLVP